MIDTHCHLFESEFDNLYDIIDKISEEKILCINNGCDEKTNLEVINLYSKYKFLYPAIGFHPSEVLKLPKDYLYFIEKNINKVVAIGEIGLDYYYDKENKDEQIELFKKQLDIAKKYNKPVIVHSRDSIQDTYDILSKYNVKGVIHAFSGSIEMAKNFINLGFKIGVGGVITFKKCNLKDVIREISLNDIVLETDSPYLSPEPVRGKKNTPLNLKYIAEYIANLKGISCEEVLKITSDTSNRLFDLSN